MKLDFLVGAASPRRCARPARDEFRGNQAMLGEVIAWRNLFWALSDAMASDPVPWVGDTVLPNVQSGSSYRVFAGEAYPRIKEIVEKIVASALIYLPSSAKDFTIPAIDRICAKYVRGSHGIGYRERIKIMKLLWDAVGTEFGGRHELYEINYAGNHEDIRIQALCNARARRRRTTDGRARRASAWPTTTRTAGDRHLAQPGRRRLPARAGHREGGGVGRGSPNSIKLVGAKMPGLTASPFRPILSYMVNYSERLDRTFAALVDPTRRAILARLEREDGASISALAQPFAIKLPAVMKHLDVLDDAGLITRSKVGRTVTVRLRPQPMREAMDWLRRYERFWSNSLDRLAAYAESKEAEARKNRR